MYYQVVWTLNGTGKDEDHPFSSGLTQSLDSAARMFNAISSYGNDIDFVAVIECDPTPTFKEVADNSIMKCDKTNG